MENLVFNPDMLIENKGDNATIVKYLGIFQLKDNVVVKRSKNYFPIIIYNRRGTMKVIAFNDELLLHEVCDDNGDLDIKLINKTRKLNLDRVDFQIFLCAYNGFKINIGAYIDFASGEYESFGMNGNIAFRVNDAMFYVNNLCTQNADITTETITDMLFDDVNNAMKNTLKEVFPITQNITREYIAMHEAELEGKITNSINKFCLAKYPRMTKAGLSELEVSSITMEYCPRERS